MHRDAFVRDLLEAEPRLSPVYREHLADNQDELLLHILLGEVTQWLRDHGPVAPVMGVLERYFVEGDDYVQEAIAVSFVEGLEPADVALRQALGPALRAELQQQEAWGPTDHDQPT
jgi:hypothetical protein